MKHKLLILAVPVLAAFILSVAMILTADTKDPGNKAGHADLSIYESMWIFTDHGEKMSASDTTDYNGALPGDVIYDYMGYRIIVEKIYENKVVVRQEGGLVPANENGGFDALGAAQDCYDVWRDRPLVLRPYSLTFNNQIEITFHRAEPSGLI